MPCKEQWRCLTNANGLAERKHQQTHKRLSLVDILYIGIGENTNMQTWLHIFTTQQTQSGTGFWRETSYHSHKQPRKYIVGRFKGLYIRAISLADHLPTDQRFGSKTGRGCQYRWHPSGMLPQRCS
jgi:hypothetical protein